MAADLFFIAIVVAFAVASWGFVVMCDKLMEAGR